jgi:hypothetical protein
MVKEGVTAREEFFAGPSRACGKTEQVTCFKSGRYYSDASLDQGIQEATEILSQMKEGDCAVRDRAGLQDGAT